MTNTGEPNLNPATPAPEPSKSPSSNPTQAQLEALKLIKDWSVWMVTAQLALLAGLSFKEPSKLDCAAVTAVVITVLSMALATLVVTALPSIAIRLMPDVNLYTLRIHDLWHAIWLPTLGVACFAQHLCFVLSLILIVIALFTAG